MEMIEACEAFSSLSQETRLKVFKLMIQYGKDGVNPKTIAEELKIPDNTLSFHLSHMSKAGLVSSEKNGRMITYFANTKLMTELVGYLLENCCVKEGKSKSKKNCNEGKC